MRRLLLGVNALVSLLLSVLVLTPLAWANKFILARLSFPFGLVLVVIFWFVATVVLTAYRRKELPKVFTWPILREVLWTYASMLIVYLLVAHIFPPYYKDCGVFIGGKYHCWDFLLAVLPPLFAINSGLGSSQLLFSWGRKQQQVVPG